MQKDYTKLLVNILNQMSNTDHIRLEDIPDIDLYMDQVTQFMNEHLSSSKRYPEDKILTKTMINNYAKNKLLPPPEKKRYSQEHMLVLLFIYYFKSFLPLADIQALLHPITEHFFNSDSELDIQQIYDQIYNMGKDQISESATDIMNNFHVAAHSFSDCPDESKEFMQLFSFICLLSFDIYLKKQVIEKMIDHLPSLPEKPKSKK